MLFFSLAAESVDCVMIHSLRETPKQIRTMSHMPINKGGTTTDLVLRLDIAATLTHLQVVIVVILIHNGLA